MLDTQSIPLRNYLMRHVMPTLTQGLIEVCKVKPDDPVDYLVRTHIPTVQCYNHQTVYMVENHKAVASSLKLAIDRTVKIFLGLLQQECIRKTEGGKRTILNNCCIVTAESPLCTIKGGSV